MGRGVPTAVGYLGVSDVDALVAGLVISAYKWRSRCLEK